MQNRQPDYFIEVIKGIYSKEIIILSYEPINNFNNAIEETEKSKSIKTLCIWKIYIKPKN